VFKHITKNLEIPRLQIAGVFLHLIEVRIDTPLSDLMADNGDGALGNVVPVIGRGLWCLGVDAAADTLAPSLHTRVRGNMKLIFRQLGPPSSAAHQVPAVASFEMFNPAAEIRFVVLAPRLVPIKQQGK